MIIGGLQKLTLIDFPGRLAATVFLAGCNFRCSFCYNREIVLPEEIKKHPQIYEREFFEFLKERKGLLEGVCITGGEPTINKDLPDFIKKIKNLGYLVKLDTNGSNPEMLKVLIDPPPSLRSKSGGGLIDYVAMDIKAPIGAKIQNSKIKMKNENSKLKNKYKKTVGVGANLEDIKESVRILNEGKIDYEFRTTVVPTIHKKEDILQIVREISPAKKYFLQNFRPEKTIDPKFEKIKPYPQEYLLEIQKAIAPFFEICQIR